MAPVTETKDHPIVTKFRRRANRKLGSVFRRPQHDTITEGRKRRESKRGLVDALCNFVSHPLTLAKLEWDMTSRNKNLVWEYLAAMTSSLERQKEFLQETDRTLEEPDTASVQRLTNALAQKEALLQPYLNKKAWFTELYEKKSKEVAKDCLEIAKRNDEIKHICNEMLGVADAIKEKLEGDVKTNFERSIYNWIYNLCVGITRRASENPNNLIQMEVRYGLAQAADDLDEKKFQEIYQYFVDGLKDLRKSHDLILNIYEALKECKRKSKGFDSSVANGLQQVHFGSFVHSDCKCR